MHDQVNLFFSDRSEVYLLRKILPDQSVGVFVGSPFPGVVRGGEEDASGGGLEELVALELGTVVGSDGVDGDLS